jgi:hypothetical protein
VRNAAAIRNRGELLRKSIRGRSTPQPSSLVTVSYNMLCYVIIIIIMFY